MLVCFLYSLFWCDGDERRLCEDLFCSFKFFLKKILFVQYGFTPLHRAVEKGFKEIVKILLEHDGSNIDLPDPVLIFFFFILSFLKLDDF